MFERREEEGFVFWKKKKKGGVGGEVDFVFEVHLIFSTHVFIFGGLPKVRIDFRLHFRP